MFERRIVTVAALGIALLAGAAMTCAADDGEAASTGVRAILELDRNFFYTGEPLRIRISIGNEGDKTVPNPVKSPLLKGFRVTDGTGERIEPTGKASADAGSRPEELAPLAFYGAVVDVTEIFPVIREGGTFRVQWSADGIESPVVEVQVIPKYDPTRDYRAIISTEEGDIVLDLFGDRSPIAVKAFVDMANTGVYDGLLIHEIHPEDYIVGGSPAASGSDRRVISYPAEQSSLPVVAGSVLMQPVGAAPPANSSPFVIVLRPRPEWVGQATVVGQVVDGLDVARRISKRPSSQQTDRPYFRPVTDIRIRSVRIEEKPEETESAGSSADAGS